MILYSDRDSEFTSYAFREALKKHRAIQSMSGVGRCYDNARMESFFATSTTITLDEFTAQTTAGRQQFIGRCIMNN